MKREEEIKAKSEEQRAKGKEQRAKSEEQSTEGHWSLVIGKQMPVSAVSFAPEKSWKPVEFIQQIINYVVRIGLQPNKIWLKPNVKIIISDRQLKLTAKDSEKSNFSAISFAVEFIQRLKRDTAILFIMSMRETYGALTNKISTVFQINN